MEKIDFDPNNREELLRAVTKYGLNLKHASAEFRNDREIVEAACKQWGNAFSYASEELRSDKLFVMKVIQYWEYCLKFASPALRSDVEVVMSAVEKNAYSLRYACHEIKNDKSFVLRCIDKTGYNLGTVSEELKNDRDLVMKSVKRSGSNLGYASLSIRNDQLFIRELLSLFPKNWEGIIEGIGFGLRRDSVVLRSLCKFKDFEDALDDITYDREILDNPSEREWYEFCLQFTENSHYIKSRSGYFNGSFSGITYSLSLQKQEEKTITDLSSTIMKELSFPNIRIIKGLGRGTYGVTYLCTIKGMKGLFVIKLYHNPFLSEEKTKDYVKRDTMQVPYHSNVVFIYGSRTEEKIDFRKQLPDYEKSIWRKNNIKIAEDIPVILMKYHKMDLATYMMKKGDMFIGDETLFILSGIIEGASHLHNNKIVHRDLTPNNVFLDPLRGRIWIGDFGCALDLRDNETRFKVNKNEEILYSIYSSFTGSFRGGGGVSILPPEIIHFDPKNEEVEFIDYEKCDSYSCGKLGKMILEETYFMFGGDDYDTFFYVIHELGLEDVNSRMVITLANELMRDQVEKMRIKEEKTNEENAHLGGFVMATGGDSDTEDNQSDNKEEISEFVQSIKRGEFDELDEVRGGVVTSGRGNSRSHLSGVKVLGGGGGGGGGVSSSNTTSDDNLDDDDLLMERVMMMSKVEYENDVKKREKKESERVDIGDMSEEKMLELAIELSKQEHDEREKRKNDDVKNEVDNYDEDQDEEEEEEGEGEFTDEMLKLAIELSKEE